MITQRSPLAALKFLSLSLLAQALGVAVGMLSRTWLHLPLLFLGLHGVVASITAYCWRLPHAWVAFNFALPILLWLALSVHLSPAWLALMLMLTGLIYLPTFWTGVPYYPSSIPIYHAVLALLPDDQRLQFLDLGCGYGNLLFYLARKRPLAHFHGVEVSLLPYLMAKIRSCFYPNVTIKAKNFWALSLTPYHIVYAFLAPPPMERLWEKVKKEMIKGSTFLVNSFAVTAPADETHAVNDKRDCVLYVYRC